MAKKKTETVVVTWRVKEALRRRLESAATHNEISVNAEITRRIEESFDRAGLINIRDQIEGLINIRDQIEKALGSMMDQNRRREALVAIEVEQMRKAFYEANPEIRAAEEMIRAAEEGEPELPMQQPKGDKP